MSISIRLNDAELAAIKDYATAYGMTISECIRKAVLERIEDEYDLKCYEEAIKEYETDPETISHEDLKKKYGL